MPHGHIWYYVEFLFSLELTKVYNWTFSFWIKAIRFFEGIYFSSFFKTKEYSSGDFVILIVIKKFVLPKS